MNDATAQPAKLEPKELGKPVALDRQAGVLRFSPCGKLLAAGAYDATVRLWRVSDAGLEELPALRGHHHGWVDALAFVPGSTKLITGDTWGRLSCWDVADSPMKSLWSHEQAHDGYIRAIAASADGKHIATCGRDQIVRLWSPEGKLLRELNDHHEDGYGLAFSPDSSALVSGDLKGVIRVWSMPDAKPLRTLDASPLYLLHRIQDVGGARVLAFSRDGKTLYCGGGTPKGGGFVEATPKILRFDFAGRKLEEELTLGEPKDGFVYDLHDHASGFLLAVTSGQPGNGKLIVLRPGEKTPAFSTNKMQNTHALAPHPDGKRFAIAATNGGGAGNGRPLKNGEYVGNFSPIHLWTI